MTHPYGNSAPSSLGERLRCKRREKGWTQEQLAARANTNQAVIQKIENGRSLRPRRIDEIAAALGVNPSWLMFGDKGEGNLEGEARMLAETWAKLPEPFRSRIRAEILHFANGAFPKAVNGFPHQNVGNTRR